MRDGRREVGSGGGIVACGGGSTGAGGGGGGIIGPGRSVFGRIKRIPEPRHNMDGRFHQESRTKKIQAQRTVIVDGPSNL